MNVQNVLKGMVFVAVGIAISHGDAVAQHVSLKWQKSFGGTMPEEVHAIIPLSDSGFALTGMTESYTNGKSDVAFLRTGKTGAVKMGRNFGGSEEDAGYSILQTSDGGFVIAGYTRSYGAGGADAMLLKVNSSGVYQWLRTYGGANDDQAFSVIPASDGGYILAGWTLSYGSGGDGFIIKTDSEGHALGTRNYGSSRWDAFYGIAPTSDGGFILAGETQTIENELDAWIVKFGAGVDMQTEKKYGGKWDESAYSVKQCPDGGYVACGRTFSYGAGEDDAFVIRLNKNGNDIWTRTMGGKCSDVFYSVRTSADGGFLLTGNSASSGPSSATNGYIVKMNNNGSTLWESVLPGAFNMGSAMQEIYNGDYALALSSPVRGNSDIVYGVIGTIDNPEPGSSRYVYANTFTCIDSTAEIGWGGFKKSYWIINRENGYLQSKAPGGNGGISRIFTPEFSGTRDSGSLRVNVNFAFPTEIGSNWHNNNKFSFSLCDADENQLYTVEFKPNRSIDTATSFNIILKRQNTVIGMAKTGRVYSVSGSLVMSNLRLLLKQDNTIDVSYDAQDGLGSVTHLSVMDGTYHNFSKVLFKYQTGAAGDGNYFMIIDQMEVMEYKN